MSRFLATSLLSLLAVAVVPAACLAQYSPTRQPQPSQQLAQQPASVAQRLPTQRLAARPAGLFEHANVDLAWKAAQKSRQPMMLFVTSDHCHFCTRMKNETLAHPQLAPAFAQLFETVSVHADRDRALVQKLGVRSFPTTILISPDGKLLGNIRGFVSPEEIGARINPMLSAYYASQQPPQPPQAGSVAAQPRNTAAASSAK